MSGDTVVILGEDAFTNWQQVELEADYETPADGWAVQAVVQNAAQFAALRLGTLVQVQMNSSIALKGMLERVELNVTRSGGTTVSLSGRDMAASLVDCAPVAASTLRNLTLAAVAERLVAALGLAVTVHAAAAEAKVPRERFSFEPGETYWQFLTRYCAKVGLMPAMTPAGVLTLGRPNYTSQPVGELIHGRDGNARQTNVLEAHYSDDLAGRFTTLKVQGSIQGAGLFDGGAIVRSGRDLDLVAAGIQRTTVIEVGELRGHDDAVARVDWEIDQRRFRARTLTYTVRGAGPTPTSLWTPNNLVVVRDELLGISGVRWIAARRITRDRENGTQTQLTLKEPLLLTPEIA